MDMKQVVAGARGAPTQGQPGGVTSVAVEIEIDSQGRITVGMPPQPEETGQQDMQEDKSYMSPAQSVDDALKVARDMLTNPQAEQAAKQQGFESVDQGAMG